MPIAKWIRARSCRAAVIRMGRDAVHWPEPTNGRAALAYTLTRARASGVDVQVGYPRSVVERRLGRSAIVAVVESADLRNRDDMRGRWCDGPRDR